LILTNSGLASFYLILLALKSRSSRTEIVLPAYTAASLVVAVKEAGLTAILCDIALTDFNLDTGALDKVVTPQTLAIVGIHMFGVPAEGLAVLRQRFPGVSVIEDCAQAFGSTSRGVGVGNQADVSFFSFNRGKNLSTYGGGCVATDDARLAEAIRVELADLPQPSWSAVCALWIKMLLVAIVVHPWIYGTLYKILASFKDMSPPRDFVPQKYSGLQAHLGLRHLKQFERSAFRRVQNGQQLKAGLAGVAGISIPIFSDQASAAFTRFPLMVQDPQQRFRLKQALWQAGFETSEMYFQPLHHFFDLGYSPDDFPNAVYFSQRLLTLPSHPRVRSEDLARMLQVIRTTMAAEEEKNP